MSIFRIPGGTKRTKLLLHLLGKVFHVDIASIHEPQLEYLRKLNGITNYVHAS